MPRILTTRLLFFAHGMAVHPGLILLRPEREHDAALIAHEQRHCLQMRRDGTLRWYWRYLWPRHREAYEAEAYRIQLRIQPWHLDKFAQALATRYFLRITVAQARALLTNPNDAEGPRQ